MQQEKIIINNVEILIIKEGGEIWYPITYMGDNVLLKELSPSQLRSNGYNKYIRQFEIDYGLHNGGIQLTYCISELGLKEILLNCRIGRLSVDQKIAMKYVCEHIGLNIDIDTEEKFLDTYPESKWKQYDFWSVECIDALLKEIPNVKWQRCSKCGRYYPYDKCFFEKEGNPNNKQPLRCICKKCKCWSDTRSRISIQHINKEYECIYKRYGKEIYLLFKSENVIDIWKWYRESNYNHIPIILRSKDNILNIILYLYNNKIIKDDMNDIENIMGFKVFIYVNLQDIYKKVLNIDIVSKEGYGIERFEDAQKIILNYIKNNNINITYDYDFWSLIKTLGLTTYLKKFYDNDILSLFLKVFDYNYFSYKFKGGYKVYWTNKDNRIFSLKQLIEDDMKIPIEKIPLYLTLENLRKQSETMRNVLRNYYKNNLWVWINELYPNRFIEEDFNITVIRNVFDSIEESLIHDILINTFENVIYNQRNTRNTIKILDMIPDWLVITNNGFYIVEYFGINIKHKSYNQRIDDYKIKTLSKIDKYEGLKWLRAIYIYPEDLKDNFKGLKDKINTVE